MVITSMYNKNISLKSGAKYIKNFKLMDKLQCSNKLSIPKDKFVILYIGKYVKLKGLDVIIDSFNILKTKYYYYSCL